MKKSPLYILPVLCLLSCIEPYDSFFEERGNSMVVEAAISSLPGPQFIRISTTRNMFDKNNQHVLYITKADVSVTDEEGVVATFKEQNKGHYYSDSSFHAQAGKKYTLRIATSEGAVYESREVEALPAASLASTSVDYVTKPKKNHLGNWVEIDGFNVKTFSSDSPEQRNFYLLRTKITYKIMTYPELHQEFSLAVGDYIPAPKDCCKYCWIKEDLPDFAVFADNHVNGQDNFEIPLMFYPIDTKHFYEKVYFQVVQYSLSEDAYLFWKTLHDLKYKQGSLFDPSPAGLPGNISNISDPEEHVVGYFTVSDASADALFITKSLAGRTITYDYVFTDDCRELPNSTTVEPGFWQ